MKSVADRRLGQTIGFAFCLQATSVLILRLSDRPAMISVALGLGLPDVGFWLWSADDGGPHGRSIAVWV